MTRSEFSEQARLGELGGLSPRDRLRRLSEWGRTEVVLLDLVEESARLTMSDADEADAATEMLVALADTIRAPLAQARARRARVRALAYAGRTDDALAVCTEAIELAERAGLREEVGRARLASMHALTESGRTGEAIAAGAAARAVFTEIGEPALAAKADINTGIVHQRSDDPRTAVECFDRARPALADDPVTRGHLDNNRGVALLLLDDFAGAGSAFGDALEAFETVGAELTAAIAEGNLADLAVRQGRLARGLERFERARRRFERAGAPGHEARLLAEQADAKALLGLARDALLEYEQALPELDRCRLPFEAARARAGMGEALLRLGRFADAETALAAAATGFEELGHKTARARVDLTRAELSLANERVDQARTLVMRSLAVLEEREAEAIRARHLLARIAMATGNPDLAEAELAAAISSAQTLDLAPALADLWHTRGLMHRLRGRGGEAVAAMKTAVEYVERVRGTLQAERFRAAYLGDRTSLHEDLVAALLDTDHDGDVVSEAFAAAERSKSRVLLDQIGGALDPAPPIAASDEDPKEAELGARMSTLRAELSALYSRLSDDRHGGNRRTGAWQQAIRERERELEAVESRVLSVRGAASLFAPSVGLDEIQARLTGQTALVEYFSIGGEIVVFVVARDQAFVCRRLARMHEVAEMLRRLRFQIDRALRPGALDGHRAERLLADARRELEALHGVLIRPFLARLEGRRRLYVVPHGVLHQVPFHALFDGERHLIETHDIRYAPSASTLLSLEQRARADATVRSLVVGVPDDAAPRIGEEAKAVARAIGADDLLLGSEATIERFARSAPDARLLHLACHGRFDRDHPRSSGLRLGDRWLTLPEILELRLRARLVTLSACESAANVVGAGDELVGLYRAFLAAGADSVLATLWRVHDESTQELMGAFYDAWQTDAGASSGALLRQTQLQIMKQRPHPALWAPFVLIGGVR